MAIPPHIGWGKYFRPVKLLFVLYVMVERGATSTNWRLSAAVRLGGPGDDCFAAVSGGAEKEIFPEKRMRIMNKWRRKMNRAMDVRRAALFIVLVLFRIKPVKMQLFCLSRIETVDKPVLLWRGCGLSNIPIKRGFP
jgi:hypothetical protein